MELYPLTNSTLHLTLSLLQELVVHPFWQARMVLLELPAEPALDAFIQRYNLAPTTEEIRMSVSQGLKVSSADDEISSR